MNFLKLFSQIALLTVVIFSCQSSEQDLENAQRTINEVDFSADVKKLSSDEFEGRAPSSVGDTI